MKNRVKPGDTFDFRPGMTSPNGVHPGWAGMMPDADPATTPFNRLVLGLNVRYEAGQLRNRWGLKTVATVPAAFPGQAVENESIRWMGPHHMQFKAPLLWILEETPGVAFTNTGVCNIRYYNPDADPQVKLMGAVSSESGVHGIGTYGGDMYLYAAQKLYRLNPYLDSSYTGGQGGVLIAGDNNAARDAYCLQEFAGSLYVGSQFVWDGVSLSQISGGLGSFINSCVWRDALIVGVNYESTDFYCIDSVGTFVGGSLPAQMNNPYKNSMVEFRDLIYVASGDADIFAITPGDTPTAAVAHTCPTDSKVVALAVMGDVLYYLYRIVDGLESDTYLGMYEPDATTGNWTDSYKVLDTDLDAEFGGTAPLPTTMVAYRNRLVVGTANGAATHMRTLDPTSTWYKVYQGAGVPVVALKVGA